MGTVLLIRLIHCFKILILILLVILLVIVIVTVIIVVVVGDDMIHSLTWQYLKFFLWGLGHELPTPINSCVWASIYR